MGVRSIAVLLYMPAMALASFDSLVSTVSAETGVPAPIIRAVCTHESQSFHKGRRQPWPWTLNVAGQGYWFRDRESATLYAELELVTGTSSIDIGLCQINWRWHGHHFSSIAELMDPAVNVRYAAQHLKSLKGDNTWQEAIGAYHSPSNRSRAEAYATAVLSAL